MLKKNNKFQKVSVEKYTLEQQIDLVQDSLKYFILFSLVSIIIFCITSFIVLYLRSAKERDMSSFNSMCHTRSGISMPSIHDSMLYPKFNVLPDNSNSLSIDAIKKIMLEQTYIENQRDMRYSANI